MKATNTSMFRGWASVASLLLASSLAACSSETDDTLTSEDAEALELWTVVEEGASERPAPSGGEADDGIPGEADDGVVEKAGCVHIQWCNEPGPVGTVCIWDSCSLSAAVRECTADANAVCGGITQPAEIR